MEDLSATVWCAAPAAAGPERLRPKDFRRPPCSACLEPVQPIHRVPHYPLPNPATNQDPDQRHCRVADQSNTEATQTRWDKEEMDQARAMPPTETRGTGTD